VSGPKKSCESGDGTAGEFAELPPLEADEPITDDERSHYADSVFISWEMADPRDRWKWTGEASPPLVPDDKPAAKPYRTPQSTIDAFLYWIVRQDAKTQARWLAERPKDASYLQTLLEAK
jgi:hypothetical protein